MITMMAMSFKRSMNKLTFMKMDMKKNGLVMIEPLYNLKLIVLNIRR